MPKSIPPRIKLQGTNDEVGAGMDSEANMENEAEMGIVGDRIKELREAKGWTQAELAIQAGISQGVIGKIESGITKKTEKLVEIAHALDVEPGDINPKFKPRKIVRSIAEDNLAARSADDWDRLIYIAAEEAMLTFFDLFPDKYPPFPPDLAGNIAAEIRAAVDAPLRVPRHLKDEDVLRGFVRGNMTVLLRPRPGRPK